MLRRHLVVMARAPRLGAVKRRLARDVGALAAWRFYRASLATLLRRVGRDPRWTTWLAVTPDRAARAGGVRAFFGEAGSPPPRPSPLEGAREKTLAPGGRGCALSARVRGRRRGMGLRSRGVPRVTAQGPGDLGARMTRLLRRLPPGPVVIVGSDIPELSAADVARAFRLLGAHEWVFGPARDGGYWLVGTRRRPTLRPPFAGVRWSSRHALSDTLANLGGDNTAFLRELEDVDSGAALARLRRRERARLSGRSGAP